MILGDGKEEEILKKHDWLEGERGTFFCVIGNYRDGKNDVFLEENGRYNKVAWLSDSFPLLSFLLFLFFPDVVNGAAKDLCPTLYPHFMVAGSNVARLRHFWDTSA